jgi:hypothetical protein
MTTYTASSTEQSSATTENDIQVTASASATATSSVSQDDAQNIANLVASQDAMSQAIFSANLLNQSIIVNNLQQYEPILQGYILYSEILQNENYVIKTEKYTLLNGYANLYDMNTDKIIGTWGNYKQISYDGTFFSTYQQYYVTLIDILVYYACNRFQRSQYVPIGYTDISQVVTYHNDNTNKDVNQYIPYIWTTHRPSNDRLEITILKGISDNSA